MKANHLAQQWLVAALRRTKAMVAAQQRRVWLCSLGYAGTGCYIESVDRLINPHNICIGERVWIGSHLRLEAIDEYLGHCYNAQITLGPRTQVGFYVHIGAAYSIKIGHDVVIGSHVTIVDHDHGTSEPNINVMYQHLVGNGIRIDNYCWIGAGSVILKGVVLEESCVVGANSVVTHSFPVGSIIAGVPARIIGNRIKK